MKNTKGVTLMALTITIIILTILAGTALSITINQGGIIDKSQNTVEQWNDQMANENTTVNTYVENLDEAMAPARKYGYNNANDLVLARDLCQMSRIKYYYDSAKDPIICIVAGNKNGVVEVWPYNKVDEFTLGYDDPYATVAFVNGAPEGYEDTNYDRARWSYNHAIATLNTYAQKYKSDMAVSVRCIGADPNNIILSEDDTTNMYSTSGWTQLQNGPYDNTFKASEECYGIGSSTPWYEYFRSFDAWAAGRATTSIYGNNISGVVEYARKGSGSFSIGRDPTTGNNIVCRVSTGNGGNTYAETGYSITREFLPVIVLKGDVYVERVFDATDMPR